MTGIWGNVLSAAEDLEGWVTIDAILLAKSSLLGAVNLGQLDIFLLQCGGGILILGGKCFAMPTI